MMGRAIVIPKLYCPFPSHRNAYAAIVEPQALQWAVQFDLVPTLVSERAWRGIGVTELAARTFTSTNPDVLSICSDWNTWLHVWDDICDENEFGRIPELLAAHSSRLMEIFCGDRVRLGESQVAHALQDLRDRMRRSGGDEWMARFALCLRDYFHACQWEAHNRASGIVPSIESYIPNRRNSGAVYTEFVLFEIAENIRFSDFFHSHPIMQQFALMANNVICWCNDILSCEKELLQGDVHNLVVVLHHEHGIDFQEAAYRAAGFVEAEVRSFMRLESATDPFHPEMEPQARRYIAFLKDWMRGNIDWSYVSGRFGVSLGQAEREAQPESQELSAR